ncbi:MAG TPA: TetR/AcrR family transcriptional regulator [Candidatus Binataceae bacterium]|nr:TetR/AcrR family transcriptional regulator [Candidatus Binataceae bacterium]
MRNATSTQIRSGAIPDNFGPRPFAVEPLANGNNKRERILAAGLRLFANESYQAVTMDRVAEAAGVAKGTLYLYFPSKEALYLGILSDGLDTVSRRYQSGNDPRQDVGTRLRRAIEVTIQFYDERRDLLRLIATEEPRLADARNRLIQSSRERGFVFYTNLIEEGIRTGVFGPTDSRAATLAIVGGIRSVLLYYGSTRPARVISQELGDFYLKGLVARAPESSRVVASIARPAHNPR